MTPQQLKKEVRALLDAKYPDYMTKPRGERILLAMSVMCLNLRIHEQGANNRGEYVDAIVASTGLDPNGGYAWCAATINFACDVAETGLGPNDPKSASVQSWREWASEVHRATQIPGRGRLCSFLHSDGTGHMGIVAEVYSDGRTRTYEGNTSSGTGSDRDGDGLYERIRPAGFWTRFIEMNA